MSITIPFSLQTIPETEAIKEEMRVNGGKKQPFDVSWEIHNQLLQKLRPLEA